MFIMEDIEIDSLVKKFKMLRSVGYDATLHLVTTEKREHSILNVIQLTGTMTNHMNGDFERKNIC